MKNFGVRDRLIENTIKVIALNGLDKTTTKAIVCGTDINEAYIYSYFAGKEDLLVKVFETLDEELVTKILFHAPILYMDDLDIEGRCRMYFTAVWDFLVAERDRCLTYIRYFYSAYFVKYSVDIHKRRFEPVVDKFRVKFIEEADVWMILNHILNVMFDFAVKVHNGEMSGDDNYVEHVFRVVFRSVEQYFKKEEKNNE